MRRQNWLQIYDCTLFRGRTWLLLTFKYRIVVGFSTKTFYFTPQFCFYMQCVVIGYVPFLPEHIFFVTDRTNQMYYYYFLLFQSIDMPIWFLNKAIVSRAVCSTVAPSWKTLQTSISGNKKVVIMVRLRSPMAGIFCPPSFWKKKLHWWFH